MRALLFLILVCTPLAALADNLPQRFLQVAPGIFRSAQPNFENLEELRKKWGLKTIINLNDDDDWMADEAKWASELGIRLASQPLSGFFAPSDEQIDAILAELENPANQPILVHCLHGQDRTGLIVGLYRVFHESWQPQYAYEEMLNRGFHTYLLGLDNYFHQRTGWSL